MTIYLPHNSLTKYTQIQIYIPTAHINEVLFIRRYSMVAYLNVGLIEDYLLN